ncbi:dual specificity protein kinase splB isoform X2 [Hydra vulgaris]|uniref:dual specificity protein kinase splB isoform X2 n=1 Tax=Hydra vulgaris TaxID=6087 RepID=UPI001F5FAAFE|nr:dual specificity protein kinase splB isoform X2 [Hydra vulgaris]
MLGSKKNSFSKDDRRISIFLKKYMFDDHLRIQNSRFPRIEEMSHFHYSNVDFGGSVTISVNIEQSMQLSSSWEMFAVEVVSKEKWTLKRSYEDFVGLDRMLHRCLYGRGYSKLPELKALDDGESVSYDMAQMLQAYVKQFSDVSGNNINCGPVLNWLELDNHGNHLFVMEADDSAINVPAIAAGRVIKRYQSQAPDEMTLDVGEFISIIDMPHVDETVWWRGKKGFEVGFFPSNCIEVLGEKDVNDKAVSNIHLRPLIKRRGKLVSFLRFFFKSRPSKDELMQHGILRERVFGCDLGEYLALTGHDIPIVLEMCSKFVEEHGIVDGIYRLSGIMSNLQRLRVAFDSQEKPPNLEDQKYLNDIHCISSLLKTYFRELPNPLFTYELYTKFVAAINKEGDTEKTVAFHHVIQRLPPPHYRTMHYLFLHLNVCAQHSNKTNMTAKNLAIVWAPNLLRPNIDDSVGALAEFRTQAIIVEYMIRNVKVFFDKNAASATIAYYPENQDENQLEEQKSIYGSVSRIFQPTVVAKLISLDEARERVRNVSIRKASYSPSTESNLSSNSYPKLHSTAQPLNIAASPISPLPSLLSLEEAQARSKAAFLSNQRSSSDVGMLQTTTMSPKRSRKWLGLFSRAKSASPSQPVERSNKHPSVYKLISSPQRSISEINIHNLRKQQIEHTALLHTASEDNLQKKDIVQHKRTSVQSASFDHTDADYLPFCNRESDDDSSIMSAIEVVSKKYLGISKSDQNVKQTINFSPEDSKIQIKNDYEKEMKNGNLISDFQPQNNQEVGQTNQVGQHDEQSPDRIHLPLTTIDNDLPIKKSRSLSPENLLLHKNKSIRAKSLQFGDKFNDEVKDHSLSTRSSLVFQSESNDSFTKNTPLYTMGSNNSRKSFSGSSFQLVATPCSLTTDSSLTDEKREKNLVFAHPPNTSVVHPFLANRKSWIDKAGPPHFSKTALMNESSEKKVINNDFKILAGKKYELHRPSTRNSLKFDQMSQICSSLDQKDNNGIVSNNINDNNDIVSNNINDNNDIVSNNIKSFKTSDSQSPYTNEFSTENQTYEDNVQTKPLLNSPKERSSILLDSSNQEISRVLPDHLKHEDLQKVLVRSTEENMKLNKVIDKQDSSNSIKSCESQLYNQDSLKYSVSIPNDSSVNVSLGAPCIYTNRLDNSKTICVEKFVGDSNKVPTSDSNKLPTAESCNPSTSGGNNVTTRDSIKVRTTFGTHKDYLKSKSLSSVDVSQYSYPMKFYQKPKEKISLPLKGNSKIEKEKRHSQLDNMESEMIYRSCSLQQSKNYRESLPIFDTQLKNNKETILLTLNPDLRSTSCRSHSSENCSSFVSCGAYPLKTFSKEYNPTTNIPLRDTKTRSSSNVFNKRPSSEYISSNNSAYVTTPTSTSYVSYGSAPYLSTGFHAPHLMSLSNRQVFDSSPGQKSFQLSLKDGKSHRSRPLSMHDTIDYLQHDRQQVKYEMV